jgi:hypothetical protein
MTTAANMHLSAYSPSCGQFAVFDAKSRHSPPAHRMGHQDTAGQISCLRDGSWPLSTGSYGAASTDRFVNHAAAQEIILPGSFVLADVEADNRVA